MAYFRVLSRHLSGWTEENNGNPQPGQQAFDRVTTRLLTNKILELYLLAASTSSRDFYQKLIVTQSRYSQSYLEPDGSFQCSQSLSVTGPYPEPLYPTPHLHALWPTLSSILILPSALTSPQRAFSLQVLRLNCLCVLPASHACDTPCNHPP
jgi:hypothetical protein